MYKEELVQNLNNIRNRVGAIECLLQTTAESDIIEFDANAEDVVEAFMLLDNAFSANEHKPQKTYIIDKCGYIVDELDHEEKHEESDGHVVDVLVGKNTGGDYYWSNGYGTVETPDADKYNCGIAMEHGFRCQCGKH